MHRQAQMPKRALLSVSDKTGLAELALALANHGVEILSTGGTARTLRAAGVRVTDVSEHTGFPEIMGGRVKTLHPRIHGGILARRGIDDGELAEHAIEPIDLVVANLYPFQRTVAAGAGREEAVEQIDIGGPAMVRAAAKNHADVTVVVEPADYPALLAALDAGGIDTALRRRLAATAFAHVAAYDAAIATWLADDELPKRLARSWRKTGELRYGENPHQQAAVYADPGAGESLAANRPLQGKPLSYNNLADADAAHACVQEFERPACVIVKHANPCGVAEDNLVQAAYAGAFAADPTSAFGGIIAFNRPVDEATAEAIVGSQFAEVVTAPDFSDGAREILASRPALRLLAVPPGYRGRHQMRTLDGGILVQDCDRRTLAAADLEVVSERAPGDRELADLLFAWRVVKHVRSNAIVLARAGRTVGVGAGQMSRVMSVRIAAWKAAELAEAPGAPVLASDAFFPFRDGIDEAAESGVTAVIQPGGSKRDDEVIQAANEHGMAMVLTGIRHFRH